MEKKSRKIYVVGGYHDGTNYYSNWMQGELVKSIKEADLIVFTGGEDISPILYNEKKHPKTYNNFHRDDNEIEDYKEAVNLGKKIVCICRGSQLACVLNGGKLIQHQENPSYFHTINTYDNKVITVTSTHHQAQYPFNLSKDEYHILGWTKDISSFHEGADCVEMNPPVECEIVYYPKTQSLAIQGHIEDLNTDFPQDVIYFQELLDKFMDDTLLQDIKNNTKVIENAE